MRGVIQIGAHYAEEYEQWVVEGVKNFIFFEPIKFSYEKMVRILPKSENIKTYNIALGNKTGEMEMFVETEHQGKSCSILEPKLHLKQYPDIEFHSKEIVKIDKLDNIGYDRSLYDHLHIDTQGYELEVLKGAKNSLEYIKTIQIEVYKEELYKDCAKLKDVVSFLHDEGFLVKEIKWRAKNWGDALFQRYTK